MTLDQFYVCKKSIPTILEFQAQSVALGISIAFGGGEGSSGGPPSGVGTKDTDQATFEALSKMSTKKK